MMAHSGLRWTPILLKSNATVYFEELEKQINESLLPFLGNSY